MKLGLIVMAFLGFTIAAFAITRLLQLKQPKQRPAPPLPEEPGTNELPDERMPYKPRESLLTETERAFLPALEEAVSQVFGRGQGMFDGYRVNVQVQVSRIVAVRAELERSEWQSWFNKIDRKSIDFVVCDERLRPKVAIELDDKTHQRPDRQARDAFLDRVFEAAGIQLIHIPAQAAYKAEAIAELLQGPA